MTDETKPRARASAKGKTSTAKKAAAKKPAAKKVAASSKKPTAKRKPAVAKKSAAAKKPARKKKPAAPPAPPPPSDPVERRRRASRELAVVLALAALEKKAEAIEIVDVSEKVDYADCLVLCSGRNDRQIKAIADSVEQQATSRKHEPQGRDGVRQGQWAVLDYGDVVVHIFLDEARRFYDLEGLWLDAPRVQTPELQAATARAASTAGA